MTSENLTRYALAAAARGWHVFPLQPGSKRPPRSFTDWETRATSEPDVIRWWWTNHRCNIGIACGPSGLVVIDLDTPKPGERPPTEWDQPGIRDGVDVFAALCERHGEPLPRNTFTVRTRRGGLHLYFAAPPGVRLRNTQYRPAHEGRPPRGLGWLIDTRARGGYVVGPGSHVVGDDGIGSYEVINRAPVAPLPDWLTRLHLAANSPAPPVGRPRQAVPVADLDAYARTALESEVRRVLDSPDHGHNWALNKAAYNLGRRVATGLLPYERAGEALQAAGEQVHTQDTPDQIAATIRAGLAAGMRNPTRTLA